MALDPRRDLRGVRARAAAGGGARPAEPAGREAARASHEVVDLVGGDHLLELGEGRHRVAPAEAADRHGRVAARAQLHRCRAVGADGRRRPFVPGRACLEHVTRAPLTLALPPRPPKPPVPPGRRPGLSPGALPSKPGNRWRNSPPAPPAAPAPGNAPRPPKADAAAGPADGLAPLCAVAAVSML